jgi:MOSC domain-containing protein YiiM
MGTFMSVSSLEGTVAAVACDPGHRFSKRCRDAINLVAGHGVEGDAHAGPYVRHRYLARRNPRAPNLRQVHLLPRELFDAMKKHGFRVSPGDLGENITTEGLDLEALPAGARLSLGDSAVVELTGLRTPCVLIERWKAGLKEHLVSEDIPPFRCGVMGVVRRGGAVSAGNPVRVSLPNEPHAPLPPL